MRMMIAAALLVAGLGDRRPAAAQTAVEGRVDRLEREMRAVQRKVFPGGAGAHGRAADHRAGRRPHRLPGSPRRRRSPT